MNEVRLHESSVEAVARRLAELIREDVGTGQLVDAAEIARRFGVARSWVYDHAQDLGALPLGGGSRPRLRFDPAVVAERLEAIQSKSQPGAPRRAPQKGRQRSGRAVRRSVPGAGASGRARPSNSKRAS